MHSIYIYTCTYTYKQTEKKSNNNNNQSKEAAIRKQEKTAENNCEKRLIVGWRDGSVVKNTDCSSRGTGFGSHMAVYNCLQLQF